MKVLKIRSSQRKGSIKELGMLNFNDDGVFQDGTPSTSPSVRNLAEQALEIGHDGILNRYRNGTRFWVEQG